MVSLLLFLLLINVLILVHEIGHLFFAKKGSVCVKEFAIGIGPKLFSKRMGGTLYSVRLIPFGGFNDIKGQDEKEKGEGNFIEASFLAKNLIILGGIFFNLIFGILVFYLVLLLNNFRIRYEIPLEVRFGKIVKNELPGIYVIDVVNNPALSNIKVPFILLEINGVRLNTEEDLLSYLHRYNKDSAEIVVEQGEKRYRLKNVPIKNKKLQVVIVDRAEYFLDYGYSPLVKIFSGFLATWDNLEVNLKLLWHLISTSLKNKSIKDLGYAVSGPVGVYKVVDYGVLNHLGLAYYLILLAMLSVSLALFNLLPFPGLDGWHFLVLWITAISKGRLFNARLYRYATAVGLIMLLILSIIVTIKDIRLFF